MVGIGREKEFEDIFHKHRKTCLDGCICSCGTTKTIECPGSNSAKRSNDGKELVPALPVNLDTKGGLYGREGRGKSKKQKRRK